MVPYILIQSPLLRFRFVSKLPPILLKCQNTVATTAMVVVVVTVATVATVVMVVVVAASSKVAGSTAARREVAVALHPRCVTLFNFFLSCAHLNIEKLSPRPFQSTLASTL